LATATTTSTNPARRAKASNDALLAKAVDNYQKAAEKLSASDKADDKKLGTLSLQYLVAAYGPDKLNDPAKAEPVVQKMIQLEPSEPSNYFALAKIYEDAGAYDEAEKVLQQAKAARPTDPAVYMTLAGYYNRQGHFDKTIEALEERAAKEPNNPEAFYTIATYYWDEAYRDFKLKEAEKRAVRRQGRRSGGSRAPDQARLHGSARLQEPAPPAPGEPGKRSREAAAADQGRRQAPRQGAGTAQAEGGRRQLNGALKRARKCRRRRSYNRLDPKAVRAT
jgi:tetratricopeptide (TPR) repeat protein